MCHGAAGISQANSPNLAGQYPAVIYKELIDFKTGARVNAVMAPFVANLSDQDMLDLAAYYAYLPRLPSNHLDPAMAAPPIVTNGAPMRNIAPCGSCHGDIDNKAGSPWLEGQSPPTSRRSSRPSRPAPAATISASRCATSPAR